MTASGFADRLAHYLSLTESERAALAKLERHERGVRRGAIVRREGDRASELFVVHSGWVCSYVLLDDGSRQILRLYFPGDLVGASALAYGEATESLLALTAAVLCPFDRAAVRDLFIDHPRLAALLLTLDRAEHVALTDRLASLGRTAARARIAALLLDTLDRLRLIRADITDSFHFPMTQEDIGDATGLTAVHVNRMMRVLAEEGLIARANATLTILDEARLPRVGNYVNRYAALDTDWLPAAR